MTDAIREVLYFMLGAIDTILGALPVFITRISEISESAVVESVLSITIPIGISLMVLFFMLDFAAKCINPDWITLPNISLFMVKAVAFKYVVTNSKDILNIVFQIAMNIFNNVSDPGNYLGDPRLATGIAAVVGAVEAVEEDLFSVFTLVLYGLGIFVIGLILFGSFIMIVFTLLSRVIEMFILQAVSPIPLSTLVSDGNSAIGKRFLQNYAACCLQNTVIFLTLRLFDELTEIISGLSSLEGYQFILFIFGYLCMAAIVGKSGSLAKMVTGA
ncbi:MAG: hypothetical protein LBV08_09310 [Clostridiales bacterium]|jgi:hypothetical protein|nr:hypothetical protein [Clostridiales bacterium]